MADFPVVSKMISIFSKVSNQNSSIVTTLVEVGKSSYDILNKYYEIKKKKKKKK